MKPKLLKRNSFWLALSLVLVMLSAVGASIVQTNAGKVTIKDMRWETSSGLTMSALLFKPDNVSAENKAPAIVLSHGWWNNREMQDANYVELARRGYVVVSIDMYGHGNSDNLKNAELELGGTGMYDAVKLVADLPYVDTTKIGVSGHSNGARAANYSMFIDNAAETPLISAVLLVNNDGVYTDAANDSAYFNLYGNRDVGIVADQYDEFFFRSYSPEGAVLTPPREYIGTPNAQSFLNFGVDPAGLADQREASVVYTENVDGVDAMRVVYTPPQTHPWGTISAGTVADQIDFFEEAFGAPTPMESGSQIWQVKEGFTTLGLIGLGIFLVAFTRALLSTRAFAGLKAAAPAALAVSANKGKGLAWFWGGMLVSILISGSSYILLSQHAPLLGYVFNGVPSAFTQGAVLFIAVWAAVNGLAVLVIMTASYLLFGRKSGFSLRESGVLPGWKKYWHGIGLGAVVVVAAFGIVFVLDYFFKTDFRLWVIAVKAFGADKLWIALLYVPFFLFFYTINSIAINSFNRFTFFGKEWLNTALLALTNSLALIVLAIAQYSTFAVTGELIPGFAGIMSIWLFPVIFFLIVAAVISRKIYRATNNPYIGGFINAVVVTIIAVTNTLTVTY